MTRRADHTASTTEKGDKLEEQLFDYLTVQLEAGELVYDAYPPSRCKIRKKPKYYCHDREADVEFDVVVEVYRTGRDRPHLYLVFECKNHEKPIQDSYVRSFSDQIQSVFKQSAKGVVVTSNKLQSGAERVAKNRGLGIVKFDQTGIDVVADRTGAAWAEDRFIHEQFVAGSRRSKPLRFSGFSDGRYFSAIDQMLRAFESDLLGVRAEKPAEFVSSVAFLPEAEIQNAAKEANSLIRYEGGEVDLYALCAVLRLDLTHSERELRNAEGQTILGTANFTRRAIDIHQHGNRNRERFTIAHEVGHFALGHERYLRSEQTVERDLFVRLETEGNFNYERLEIQANLFASELLLPDNHFRPAVDAVRQRLGMYDKGFGYIFVDDQQCNYAPYYQLLYTLSDHFGASKRAIEVKLKRAGLVTDNRKPNLVRPSSSPS